VSSRLADRLNLLRRRQFVGRAAELALFEQALAADDPPFALLHVYGPGGVGKTTLLKAFAQLAAERGARVIAVDARETEATPEGFLAALRRALELPADAEPLEALQRGPQRQLLLVDTYEALAAIDGWLRDDFMPQLPAQMLVALAGREPPALGWRTDLAWQTLLHPIALRNLSPEESRVYLDSRRVPAEQQQPVLAFTHGHPLALSLVADMFAQRPVTQFQPEQTPDVIKSLLGHLVQRVPGPAHRVALEICALARLTTEGLLAETLELLDAHELFDWLRGLSFVEATTRGIFPHDLAREALVADLRWRNPEWYNELHRRVRAYYTARLGQVRGLDQQRALFDLIYLHRDNPVIRPLWEWQEGGSALPEPARLDEHAGMLRVIERHEGPEAAMVAARWLAAQPWGAFVLRDPEPPGGAAEPAGLLIQAALHEAGPEMIAADPLASVAWEHIQRTAPLRPGEAALLFRFWMTRDGYQAVSALQSSLLVSIVRQYLVLPNLAYSCFACANPAFWAPGLAYADLHPIPGGELSLGGQTFGLYGHDWRATPPAAWLALLATRETAREPQEVEAARPAPALLVLSEEAFAGAVRDALHDFTRPDALRDSPLARSRLVMRRLGAEAAPGERGPALQAAIREAAAVLQGSPRDLKAYRALHHTYFQPAATQEQAAELLDLPFSTYRRHLKSGVSQVTELLWRQETQGE
jgi:energy-coupling factor transporter ATP-binding protein EcfA2